MRTPEVVVADPSEHRRELVELNTEYLAWVFGGIATQFGAAAPRGAGISARAYAATMLDRVCVDASARGVFRLVMTGLDLCGMGGIRRLDADVAEIKRLYIRPAHRGLGLGAQTLRRLMSDARTFGYRTVCLDTALFMTSAHRLYEREGFTDCPAYAGVEVPPEHRAPWRYMRRAL